MSDAPSSTLYLLRHAHSSWALPGQRDHQRPLDERGLAEAPSIGAEMARSLYRVDAILCSTATRAVQTLSAIRGDLPGGPSKIAEETVDALYALGIEAYYAAARTCGTARAVLIVGHNPMIEEFAASLATKGDAKALRRLAEGVSTAGLAVIDFDVPLAEIAPGSGTLRRLVHPKDLRS